MEKIVVTIKEGESGMWFATCDTAPGFFISCVNLETIVRLVPDGVRGILKARDLKS